MNSEEYLIQFLEKENTPIIKKKKHMYLAYRGLEQAYTYVLIDGVVKTSIIMKDGREFNLEYVTPVDIVSLVRDEVSNYTSAPFNVRIESDEATFYRIPRIKFWEYVKNDQQLQDYVREYYRDKLSETIESLQYMTMNGKKGAVCSFLYKLMNQFGVETEGGILIDFSVTNEDIAGFCGISTRNSVNRIILEGVKAYLLRCGIRQNTTNSRHFHPYFISFTIDHDHHYRHSIGRGYLD